MSLIFGTYASLAMQPTDWAALASQGYSIKVILPPMGDQRSAYGVKRRDASVTAAVEEYRAVLATIPNKKDRRGVLKAIAQKYGIRQNSICTRLHRNFTP